MTLLVEDIDPALIQGVQECLSCGCRFGSSFERAKEHRLRAREGFASNARRPFLQHELGCSLRVHDYQSLADLACLDDHRLSPTRHIDFLPQSNTGRGKLFLMWRSVP